MAFRPIPPRLTRQGKLVLLGIPLLLPFLFLALRLYDLQVRQGADYRRRVQDQDIRRIYRNPVRGEIRDCQGKLLAGNRPQWDLVLSPSEMRIRSYIWTSNYMMHVTNYLEETILHRKCEISSSDMRKRLRRDMTSPILLFRNLTHPEIARLMEIPEIPGVHLSQRLERDYPYPGIGTHLLGHCGWKHRIPVGRKHPFIFQELQGITGIEQRYDKQLSGTTGVDIVLMDPSGGVRKTLPGSSLPIDGFNLKLTIDADMQEAADRSLIGHHGALVCMDIHTGAIRAIASAPTYDLSVLSGKLYAELAENSEERALFFRAVQGSYLPGSILKPLIGLAAMEENLITEDSTQDCIGYFSLGNTKIHCSNRNGHGTLDLKEAIAVSCNPYFLTLGQMLGAEREAQYYKAAGFGTKTGIELFEPVKGHIPLSRGKRLWTKADTAFAGIGQGAISVTPLQAARYAAALANGGTVWKPYLVQEIYSKNGTILHTTEPEEASRIIASPEHFRIIREAMELAVRGKDASAEILRHAPMPLAAKTGTAEVGLKAQKDHYTWIICYGPLPDPSFAIACVIEHGVSGAKTTAPVILDFLNRCCKIPRLREKMAPGIIQETEQKTQGNP